MILCYYVFVLVVMFFCVICISGIRVCILEFYVHIGKMFMLGSIEQRRVLDDDFMIILVIIPPQNIVLGGYTFFSLSVIP